MREHSTMSARAMNPADAIQPMLATSAPAVESSESLLRQLDDGWVFEPKLDGFRCLMHVVDGTVTLRSRTARVISQRFSATPLPRLDGSFILDGELIALDENGRPSFNLVQRANGRPGDPTATYVAFDLLFDSTHGDLRDQAWSVRREALDQLQAPGLTVIPYSPSGGAMWEMVLAQGLEGAIAKRIDAKYRAGRSADWVKLKRVRELSAIVTRFNEGTGQRSGSFGSLALALLNDAGGMVAIGGVGSGFNERDLRDLKARRPPFVVEVRYQEWTGTALRMPVFKGVRDDVEITDCTIASQLPEARRN
jgi:bifunctional non-homologous end joining protein LigD